MLNRCHRATENEPTWPEEKKVSGLNLVVPFGILIEDYAPSESYFSYNRVDARI